MLRWALVFFLVAIVAGIFGFSTAAGEAFLAAKILFVIFLVMAIVSLVLGRRTVSEPL